MGTILRSDSINKLVLSSVTVVTLPLSNIITVGARQNNYENKTVDVTTNGIGGLDVGSIANFGKYYVYAVQVGLSIGLVASLSEISPVGFLSYRKVGAFYVGQFGDIIQALPFGSAPRNLSCVLGLNANVNVLTAVNFFLDLNKVFTDTASMSDTGAIRVPEDGMWTLSAQTQVFNISGIQRHTFKVRTDTNADVAVASADIPVANNRYQQVVPSVDIFLFKNDRVLLNVDSTSDANYFIEAGPSLDTFLSASKKVSPGDIDWNHY